VPDTGQIDVEDIVRDQVSFQNQIIGDFIIMKSNGIPTYNFACVVDDYFMDISHVIRADEHLSNTPKQILLYQSLGYPLPLFAHVPMILAPDRSKLSKRHGATSVEELRDDGYLPEAILNYLSLLGWSPEGEEELFPLSEITSRFSLEKVSHNPAIYDLKKLTWINGHYLREQDLDKITQAALPFFQQKGLIAGEINPEIYERIKAATGVVRDRVKTLAEVADAAYYFFRDDFSYESKGVDKHFKKEKAATILQEGKACLAGLDDFSVSGIEEVYRNLTERLQIKTADIFHPTRLAVTGRTVGPGLFDLMALVGKEKVLERLDRAVQYMKQLTSNI
jgi:glutamyl-tRNA synthetase